MNRITLPKIKVRKTVNPEHICDPTDDVDLSKPQNFSATTELLPNLVLASDGKRKQTNQVAPQSFNISKDETDMDGIENLSKSAVEYGDQDSYFITKQKNKNNLENTQFTKSEDYINKLRFNVKLDKLYTIYDSCHYNTDSKYCPVVVKVGQKLQNARKEMQQFKYLLQVWSVEGKLIFERPLDQPLEAWNIHGNLFFFQESAQKHYNDNFYLLKIGENNSSELINFTLPTFDQPTETIEKMESNGKNSKPIRDVQISSFKENGVISKLIGIASNHVLICRDKKIYYISIDSLTNYATDIDLEQTKYFMLHKGFSLLQILDIGNGQTALVVQNFTRNVKFYQIMKFGQLKGQKTVDVELRRLGFYMNERVSRYEQGKFGSDSEDEEDLNPIIQMRFVVKPVAKFGKYNCTAAILREKGNFELYSDFDKVSVQKERICNKIETDNDNYFFTFKPNPQLNPNLHEVYKIEIYWEKLIGMSVATKVISLDLQTDEGILWEKAEKKGKLNKLQKIMMEAQHRQVSSHFKLFSQFINFNSYILVAHREYVSIFDLKSLDAQGYHFKYNDEVVLLVIGSQQEHVVVMLGNNEIHLIHLDEATEAPVQKQKQPVFTLNENIKTWSVDQANDSAIYFMTQEGAYSYQTFNQIGINRFRNSKPIGNSETFHLSALSSSGLHKLSLPDEDGNNFIQFDCHTQVRSFIKNGETHLMISNKKESQSFRIEISKEGELRAVEKSCKYSHMIEISHNFSEEVKQYIDQEFTHNAVTTHQPYGQTQIVADNNKRFVELSGKLLGVIVNTQDFSSKKQRDIARITTQGIEIYDKQGKLIEYFGNPNIRGLILVDNNYIYCLCQDHRDPIKKIDFINSKSYIAPGASISKQEHGLYVYDINSLFKEGQIENYMLAPAIVGRSNYIDNSNFSQRFSYFTSFQEISMLPFPHRNTINFIGMGSKKDYLIWREKNGFFTALHKTGQLRVWSLSSGKLISSKKVTDIPEKKYPHKINVERLYNLFEIYQRNDEDTCYVDGFQNFKNHSIQLLVKKDKEEKLPQTNSPRKRRDTFDSQAGRTISTSVEDKDDYQFLVLKLTTTDDFKKNSKTCSLKVKIIFRFKFSLGLKQNWPALHLSKNCKKLMEVIDGKVAVIYKKFFEESLLQKEVVWVKDTRINQYPCLLQGKTSLPFLFDPKFDRYIDIDYAAGNIVVKSTSSKLKDQKPILIPNTLLSLEMEQTSEESFKKEQNKSVKNEDSVARIAKRMHFFTKNLIRFVNLEGIDMLFDLRSMKVVAFSKLDNLSYKNEQDRCHNHLILDKKPLDVSEILPRLIRRCQSYKAEIEYAKYELDCRVFKKRDLRKLQKLPNLYTFVYKTNYNQSEIGFMAEMSFTLLDWKICERMTQDPLFNLNEIDRYQQIQLCFNIFPQNCTILHKLAMAAENSSTETHSSSINSIVQTLFSVCRKGLLQDEGVLRKGESFEMPIVQDIYGRTVLDIAFTSDEDSIYQVLISRIKEFIQLLFRSKQKKIIFKDINYEGLNRIDDKIKKYVYINYKLYRVKRMLNSQLAVTIFANIRFYSFLHSSPFLTESLCKAVAIGLPGIGEYLDSCLKSSDQIPMRTQHNLKNLPQHYYHISNKYEITDEQDDNEPKWIATGYNAVAMQVWDDRQKMVDDLFLSNGVQKQMIIKYLDTPLLHLNRKEGFDFIKALKDLDDNHIDLFTKRAIQILINCHWKRSQWIIIVFLFVPYLVLLSAFLTWSNFCLMQRKAGEEDWTQKASGPLQVVLIVLCTYFLCFDMVKFVVHPVEFVKEIWNYLGVPPMILVLINATSADYLNLSEQSDQSKIFWQSQAFAALLMWIRCLYYLRGFQAFSLFIRTLIAVIQRILIFIMVLAIVVLAFANTFYSMSQTDEKPAITSYIGSLKYSYFIVIGQFDDSLKDQEDLTWFFFVLCTIISMLILANMLIEIVSNTFGDIKDKMYLYVFKERCELICDMQTFTALTHGVYQFFREMFRFLLWLVKILTCKKCKVKDTLRIQKMRQDMIQRCQLLIVAWEDPENNDPTPDDLEEELVETTDEKLDTLVSFMKTKNMSESEESVHGINAKLNRVINLLSQNKSFESIIPASSRIPDPQSEGHVCAVESVDELRFEDRNNYDLFDQYERKEKKEKKRKVRRNQDQE